MSNVRDEIGEAFNDWWKVRGTGITGTEFDYVHRAFHAGYAAAQRVPPRVPMPEFDQMVAEALLAAFDIRVAVSDSQETPTKGREE